MAPTPTPSRPLPPHPHIIKRLPLAESNSSKSNIRHPLPSPSPTKTAFSATLWPASISTHQDEEEWCVAKHDFNVPPSAERVELLSFKKGERVRIIRRDQDRGWWDGVLLDGYGLEKSGWFPSNYVSVLDLSTPSSSSSVAVDVTSPVCALSRTPSNQSDTVTLPPQTRPQRQSFSSAQEDFSTASSSSSGSHNHHSLQRTSTAVSSTSSISPFPTTITKAASERSPSSQSSTRRRSISPTRFFPPPSSYSSNIDGSSIPGGGGSTSYPSSSAHSYSTTTTAISSHSSDHSHSTPSNLLVPVSKGVSLLSSALLAGRTHHVKPSITLIVSATQAILSLSDEPELRLLRARVNREVERLRVSAAAGEMNALGGMAKGVEEACEILLDRVRVGVRKDMEGSSDEEEMVEVEGLRGEDQTTEEDVSSTPKVNKNFLLRLHQHRSTPSTPKPRAVKSMGNLRPAHSTSTHGGGAIDDFQAFLNAQKAKVMPTPPKPLPSPPQLKPSEVVQEINRTAPVLPRRSTEDPGWRNAPPHHHQLTSHSSSLSIFTSLDDYRRPAADITLNPDGSIDVVKSVNDAHGYLHALIAGFLGHILTNSTDVLFTSIVDLAAKEIVSQIEQMLAIVDAVLVALQLPDKAMDPLKEAQIELHAVTREYTIAADDIASLPARYHDVYMDDLKGRIRQMSMVLLRCSLNCVMRSSKAVECAYGQPPLLVSLPMKHGFKLPDVTIITPAAAMGRADLLPQDLMPASQTLSNMPNLSGNISSFIPVTEDVDRASFDSFTEFRGFLPSTQAGGPTKRVSSVLDIKRGSSPDEELIKSQTMLQELMGIKDVEEDDPDQSRTSASTEVSLSQSSTSGSSGRTEAITLASVDAISVKEFSPATDDSLSIRDNTPSLLEYLKEAEKSFAPTTFQLPSLGAGTLPLQIAHKTLHHLPKLTPSFPSSSRLWLVGHDYHPDEICFNQDGNIIGATLSVIVEKMSPHDTTVNASFSTMFFTTFHMFSSAPEIVEHCKKRFNLSPPQNTLLSSTELQKWKTSKLLPVRLRVFNFLKSWLEYYWRDSDKIVLRALLDFAKGDLMNALPSTAATLIAIVNRKMVQAGGSVNSSLPVPKRLHRAISTGMLRSGSPAPDSGFIPALPGVPPPSIVPRGRLFGLKASKVNLLDFDAMEIARQITLMESKLYGDIKTQDLINNDKTPTKALKAMSSYSNSLTVVISEMILSEGLDTRRRVVVLKYFIKLATKLVQIQNFSAAGACIAALGSAGISRLKKLTLALPEKSQMQLENLKALYDVSRNHYNYRAALRQAEPPALPYLGIILSDIVFAREMPNYRPSPTAPDLKLINIAKWSGVTKLIIDFQRFQRPFVLSAVPELQMYLSTVLVDRSANEMERLYRQSLRVEPRS